MTSQESTFTGNDKNAVLAASGLSDADICSFVEYLRSKFSLSNQPSYAELTALAETWHGKVFKSDHEDIDVLGQIEITSDSTFVVQLRNSMPYAHDRLALAHELGHFALHYVPWKLSKNDPGAYPIKEHYSTKNLDLLIEKQAMVFAFALVGQISDPSGSY